MKIGDKQIQRLYSRIMPPVDHTDSGIGEKYCEPVLNDSEIALLNIRAEHDVLSQAGQIRLIKMAQNGDRRAKERLIEHNLGLITRVARSREGCDFVDLVQAGACGMLRAIEKFDCSRGACFSTYATIWIKQAIGRYIDEHSCAIRQPVHVRDNVRKIARSTRRLEFTLGRDPSTTEIALDTGLSETQVLNLADFATTSLVFSLDSLSSEVLMSMEEQSNLSEQQQPEVLAEEHERAAFIAKMLKTLKPVETKIMMLRAGIDQVEPMTLQEVGDRIGISRERVRQIQARAIKKLKESFSDSASEFLE